jgi:ABC-type glutathione transport system ATPase component
VLVDLFSGVRRELGTTLVVIEHDLPLLFRLADRLVAMELGQVIAQGSPEAVRNHPDVVRSYLGGDVAAVGRSGTLDFAETRAVQVAVAGEPIGASIAAQAPGTDGDRTPVDA